MEDRLKELEWIVKNRLFYLKRLKILFDIANENLMDIGKRSYGGIFHDSENWLDQSKRKGDISEHFFESINNYFVVTDKVKYPKNRDDYGKFSLRLSLDFYEDLFCNQMIKIQNFLKKGLDTKVKYSFFDSYRDSKGNEKYRSYKLLPEPFKHVQIRLIYLYRFIMIKLKKRSHYLTHDKLGKTPIIKKNYNDYSNHAEFIFKYSETMKVDTLEDAIRQRYISFNEIEIDKFLNQLEDAIRKSYDHSHRRIMDNFQMEAFDRAQPYMQFLYSWDDPEEKQELPTIENINIDEANILSRCLEKATKEHS